MMETLTFPCHPVGMAQGCENCPIKRACFADFMEWTRAQDNARAAAGAA